jgi:hypothetical protein
MTFSYSYDPTTAVGAVRLSIGDAESTTPVASLPATRKDWGCIFSDEEISAVLSAVGGDQLEAAAALCDKIAVSLALQEASIRVGDYSLDPKGMAALMAARAKDLRAQAHAQPAEALVEPYSTDFQTREHLLRALLDTIPGWSDP